MDVLRGVAVMGILVANLPAFGLPEAAYFSPAAWGGTSPADTAAWLATYVLVESKMRGLFSLLFGASLLLVVGRAEVAGRSGAAVHYRRMAWLFVIGCAHLYLVWWGDILAHYALVGGGAYLFARRGAPVLVATAVILIAISTALALSLYLGVLSAEATSTPANARFLAGMAEGFGAPPARHLAAEVAAYRGGYAQAFRWRIDHVLDPFTTLLVLGPETLATMLLGMAGLKSGFLTGAWSRRRYVRWAGVLLGVSLPVYLVVGLHTAARGFRMDDVILGSMVVSSIARTPAILGLAALILLATHSGGWLAARIAAAGRTALTNYLATSLAMTIVFYGYGLGLFGRLSRAELYWLAPLAWIAMLAWSPAWLARYRYGPLEWAWRSVARGRVEPLRRRDDPILQPMRK